MPGNKEGTLVYSLCFHIALPTTSHNELVGVEYRYVMYSAQNTNVITKTFSCKYVE